MISSVARKAIRRLKRVRNAVAGLSGFQFFFRELALRDLVHPWITAQVQPKGLEPSESCTRVSGFPNFVFYLSKSKPLDPTVGVKK